MRRNHTPFCHAAGQSCARTTGPVAKRHMIPSRLAHRKPRRIGCCAVRAEKPVLRAAIRLPGCTDTRPHSSLLSRDRSRHLQAGIRSRSGMTGHITHVTRFPKSSGHALPHSEQRETFRTEKPAPRNAHGDPGFGSRSSLTGHAVAVAGPLRTEAGSSGPAMLPCASRARAVEKLS